MSERLKDIRRRVQLETKLLWPEEVPWLVGEVDRLLDEVARLKVMLMDAPIDEEHEMGRKVFNDNGLEVCAEYGHEAGAAQRKLWREERSQDRTCLNCGFWEELDGVFPLYNMSGAPMDWTGWCHRYPPTRNDTDESTDDNSPTVTRHDDWCGEYVENEGACRRNPPNSAENGGFADNGAGNV